MKKLIIVILFLGASINLFSQEMWKYEQIDWSPRENQFTIDSAKQIILNINPGRSSDYYLAVEYLFVWHRNTKTQFLLNNLNTVVDSTSDHFKLRIQWSNFYTDNFFKGLLGDMSAIEKMDSIANYCPVTRKRSAIRNLAEIGRYDYYDYVKFAYLQNRDSNDGLLAMYGKDPRFKDEVLSLLEEQVRAYNLEDDMEKARMMGKTAHVISAIDTSLAVQILEDYFRNQTGQLRWHFYIDLGIIDKDGQPERAMFGLLNETNEKYRKEYIPNLRYITYFKAETPKFLNPSYIKFLKELDTQPGTKIDSRKAYYLEYFESYNPGSTITTSTMLDTLTSYTTQCYGYEWLKDEIYKTELLTKLTTAKTKLTAGDSLGCRTEVATFQNSVNQVYQDSAVSYPKYVSDAGYKFMYHYAQYILDRLPEAPTVEGLPVKLQDSQGNLLQDGTLKYYDSGWKFASTFRWSFNS